MADYRTLYDKEHLGAWDLQGREVVVTIESVRRGAVVGDGGKKASKAILKFVGKEKTMVCNVTNAKAIAGMYGNDTDAWIGKRIALFPTITTIGSEQRDCIRVRPAIPGGDK